MAGQARRTPVQVLRRVFAVVALLLLAVAGALWFNAQNFIAKSQRTQGQVVKMLHVASNTTGDDSGTWRPMVRFTAPAGQIIEFTSAASSNPPAYKEGEAVEVLYSPSNPQDARISGFFSLWFAPLIAGGLGLVFLLVSLALLLVPGHAGTRSGRAGW